MNKSLLAVFAFVAVFLAGAAVVRNHLLAAQSQESLKLSELPSGTYDTTHTNGEYYGVPVQSQRLAATSNPVLGATTTDRHIEVDLTNQRLMAFEGETKVYEFLISSGKWGRTPTGTFTIWSKFRYKHMSGGNKQLGTYYNLPNVPYTMFFANADVPAARGFGIHGTYWHNNFGHPMSHGCINMKTEEAEVIFNWTGPVLEDGNFVRAEDENPGTPVIIYGTAPQE